MYGFVADVYIVKEWENESRLVIFVVAELGKVLGT